MQAVFDRRTCIALAENSNKEHASSKNYQDRSPKLHRIYMSQCNVFSLFSR